MARTFTSKEAKTRIADIGAMLSSAKQAAALTVSLQTDVETAARAMVTAQVKELLGQIPVEEVNREKRGFRTALLRENGIETLADLNRATVRQVADINGIGDATAQAMKETASELAEQASQGIRIRLSQDKKIPEATALVTALSRLRQCEPLCSAFASFLAENGQKITGAAEALKPAASAFSWLFASGAKKQAAENAYALLEEGYSSGIFPRLKELVQECQGLAVLDGAAAWQDFGENSIALINLLEKVVPGVMGPEDAVYGLPEELARAIQEQPLDLTGLRCTLRHYQEWGVKYICHQQRVLLGDEMGLGKTVQAIAAMVSLRNTGKTHFAVVCPASVISNWCREIAKHSDIPVTKVHGDHREEALAAWLKDGGAAVTTYETTGHFKLEEAFQFAMLVVDEAHYIKNPAARRTKHVKQMAAHAQHILFMTGTALENRVEEMVMLMEILQPEVAGSVKNMISLSAAPQFREKVAPVYYRRRREEVLTELPELTEIQEWCTLGKAEEATYEEAVLSENFARARRVSWNAPDIKDSSKAQRLLEIVEEAREDGRKIIVFSFFLDTIGKVRAMLGDACSEPINGSVPPERRQAIIDEFDKAPAGSVLAAQIQAGGTGLNIQSASVVVLCEPQFKPSIENQAISRAYRMGQTRDVLVYRLLCEDTVDEKITALLEQKQHIFDAFADESVVAQESSELDEKSFNAIMNEEKERIQQKTAEQTTV